MRGVCLSVGYSLVLEIGERGYPGGDCGWLR